jgi:predicted ArsR family transcriptional regulator
MKEIHQLNKLFESRIRLGIMSLLMVDEWVDYKQMKLSLKLTDGNLASHVAALEKNGLLEVKKQFVGKRPHTSYKATTTGRAAFNSHLDALESLLKNRS